MLGYHKDIHYYVGRKPPAQYRWKMPYEPPLKFDYYILFFNGFGIHLISQDRVGAARGLNLDFVLADEGLNLNKSRLEEEVFKANRGNLKAFGHIPLHHSFHIISSMPTTKEGFWLLQYGDYYYDEFKLDFSKLRNQIANLQIEFIEARKLEIRKMIGRELSVLEAKLKFKISGQGVFYNMANIFDNIENVGMKFIEDERRNSSELSFRTEILNERIDKVEGSFYPMLGQQHYYNNFNNDFLTGLEYNFEKIAKAHSEVDGDVDPFKKLEISLDFGSHINCCAVAQTHYSKKFMHELRFVNALFVKEPLILDDLANKFCDYYESHGKKELDMYHDISGDSKQANSKLTYSEEFIKILNATGWRVNRIKFPSNPTGSYRYLLNNYCMAETRKAFPLIRINEIRAKFLKLSMEQAPAKDNERGIFKDKSSEKNWQYFPQEEATHFSDTFDYLIYGKYRRLLSKSTGYVPVVMG